MVYYNVICNLNLIEGTNELDAANTQWEYFHDVEQTKD